MIDVAKRHGLPQSSALENRRTGELENWGRWSDRERLRPESAKGLTGLARSLTLRAK